MSQRFLLGYTKSDLCCIVEFADIIILILRKDYTIRSLIMQVQVLRRNLKY